MSPSLPLCFSPFALEFHSQQILPSWSLDSGQELPGYMLLHSFPEECVFVSALPQKP